MHRQFIAISVEYRLERRIIIAAAVAHNFGNKVTKAPVLVLLTSKIFVQPSVVASHLLIF